MADTKISALTAMTTAVGTDILPIVDDPGGTPVTQKITLANLWTSLKALTRGEVALMAAGGWPSTTLGCAVAKTEHVTNDVDLYSLDFDQSVEEYGQWTVWMPDDWDGSTITAKLVWTAASGTGDVIWGVQGRSHGNDDAIDQAWGTVQTVTDTLIATGDVHVTAETSAITLAGTPAAGELVQIRVYRDADAAGDTLSADARLLGVKLYYGRT